MTAGSPTKRATSGQALSRPSLRPNGGGSKRTSRNRPRHRHGLIRRFLFVRLCKRHPRDLSGQLCPLCGGARCDGSSAPWLSSALGW